MSESLKEYQKKRRFDQTPEPEAARHSYDGELTFVVQKHKASHLHYDFRLELDGVLKSWAVPKGPTLDPEVKRLAMLVEDHPIDYRTFEGIIPEGNYGAGAVIVWDSGVYHAPGTVDRDQSERLVREGIDSGNLKFVLQGKKLHGEFALVRLKRGAQNAWLLIKKRDKHANATDVTEEDRSVQSGRTIEELESSEPTTPADLDLTDAPLAEMPHNVAPMLATLVEEPFDSPEYLYEIKWDGYRAIGEVSAGDARLFSRNQLALGGRFAAVVDDLKSLGHEAVLDGELVVVDDNGRSDFQLIQNFERTGRGNLIYYVFDLLYIDGHDLRRLPLVRRKDILKRVLPGLPHARISDYVEATGTLFWRAATSRGVEGILAKKKTSLYSEGRRTRDWLKIKKQLRQEAVVAGFTEPRGGRKHFGSLILGLYDGNDLKYVGGVGAGFDDRMLADLENQLKALVQETSPFRSPPKTDTHVQWVKPELVCEVRFSEWTADGMMRHPVFVGMRTDRRAREVTREGSEAAPLVNATKVEQNVRLRIGSTAVALTNLDKLYWPGQGYTKGDLVDYYRSLAPLIMPHLLDRPENLLRHPDGIAGKSFYQKDVDEQPPDWVKKVRLRSESEQRDISYLLCQDEATLVFLANLGCIEINPWLSRLGSLDRPDYLVFDLDPLGIGFDAVVEAALTIREILELAGLASYCKTSGATGLHVYVPLGAQYDYETSLRFAQIVAYMARRMLPDTTSLARNPARRQGKVYLDCLQNRRGQTLVAAYSLRARPGAPVSMPLRWDEVGSGLDPLAYNIKTALQRVEKMGDIFTPVLGRGIDMKAALKSLESANQSAFFTPD
ncbi:MAG: DNA ligase D [Chloroflexi bacterium]|nr:DNA ligase D [Chloroflexota bacterium]